MVIFYKFPNPYVISDSGTSIIVPKDFISTLKSLFIENPKIKKILLITDDYVIRNYPGLTYKKRLCTKIFDHLIVREPGIAFGTFSGYPQLPKGFKLVQKRNGFFLFVFDHPIYYNWELI